MIENTKPAVLYIAADGDHMLSKFEKRFAKQYGIKVVKYTRPADQSEGEAAHMDLYMLSIAQNAIVNCPSTFSAFAKRQRDTNNKPTHFWGIEHISATNEFKSDL